MYYPLSDSVASQNPDTSDRDNIERLTASFATSPCRTETKDAIASSAAKASSHSESISRASTSVVNTTSRRGTAPAGGSTPRLVYTTLDDMPSSSLVSRERPESQHNAVLIRDFGGSHYELVSISSASMRPPRRGTKKGCRRNKREEMSEADLERSVARSRRNMRHRVLMLRADRLLTLTYRENKADLGACWRDFMRFVRAVKKQLPRFRYVAVPERQARGAFHFHLAVRGFYNVTILRYLWRRALCDDGNASGENSPGNVDITSPRGDGTWQRAKLARYLAKYMSKDLASEQMHARRFSSSCSIEQPKITRLYLPIGDDTFRRLTQIMNSIAPKGVKRMFEFGGPVPGVWMSSF